MIGVLGQENGPSIDQLLQQYGVAGGAEPTAAGTFGTFGVNKNDPNTWRVWRGGNPENPRQADQGTPEAMADPEERQAAFEADYNRVTADPAEMLQSFYSLSDEEMDKLRQTAASLGKEMDYMSLRSLWSDLVSFSAEMFSLGGKQVSVWDAADMLAEDAELLADDETEGYTGPVTQTSTSTNLTDPQSAYSYVASFVESRLGRTPGEKEVQAFSEALRAYEEANPSVTTTTQTPGDPNDPSMGGSSTVVTEGGADPGAFTDNWAQAEFGKELDLRYANDVGGDIISRLISGGGI